MSTIGASNDISLAVVFPLPFQILALVGLEILGWSTNLHGLDVAGIDVNSSLELRTGTATSLPAHLPASRQSSSLVALYNSIYRIFVIYSSICFAFWLAWRYTTKGEVGLVDVFGYIPAMASLTIICILFYPHNTLHKTERRKFLYAVRRCLFSSWDSAVYFSDVILADIITSFAQVVGDVWLSLCMLIPGNSMLRPQSGVGMSEWILPTVMSLPYLVRLRQCVIEYSHEGNRRSLYNALKYASFPAIYLSALQRLVSGDGGSHIKSSVKTEYWENFIFWLWLLAALVNSLYSFWWDVTNDWDPSRSFAEVANHKRYYHPFGLRHSLYFPLLVYPLLIFLNLILRLTWSMKLFRVVNVSSHADITNFCLKVAELFRRWMWVFIRIEWEMIRKGREGHMKLRTDDEAMDEYEYEMVAPANPERQ
ncbi:ERD1 like protein [Termitomyces sp. J132]|nr:ERD1 like protein [Termitomyces sp. J132]